MGPSADDCADCVPAYLQRRFVPLPPPTQILCYLPFVLTFVMVAAVVSHRVLPFLAEQAGQDKYEHGYQNTHGAFRLPSLTRLRAIKITARQVSGAACATTAALSTVLVELILCEVADLFDRDARAFALRTTLVSLLGLIIIVLPTLEIYATVSGRFKSSGSNVAKVAFTLLFVGVWLGSFWYLPNVSFIRDAVKSDSEDESTGMFFQGCLKRIGIVGIALMAALAGFATVSAIWQNLGPKKRYIRETDIVRKETGLASVHSMLESKQSRLRALDQRISQQSPTRQGFLARIAGTIKGDSATSERKAIDLEIDGLETMASSLEASLATMRSRFESQRRATTVVGRTLNAAGTGFAIYCLYRTSSIALSTTRRLLQADTTISSSDPISNLIALLTAHYDDSLDYQAWARQISFAMSGVVLLLSFNAALQTFRLFRRLIPNILLRARTGLPLVVAQVAGTYVISSAILLRSNLPPQVRGVITEALGSPLDMQFAQSWFEGWFLAVAGLTAAGIAISRQATIHDWDDWDEAGDLELGKLS